MPSLRDILLGSRFVGVELFSAGETERLAVLDAKREKGELFITKTTISDNADFSKSNLRGQAVILAINTKNILHKQIASAGVSEEKAIFKAFPNIAYNDFYYDVSRFGDSYMVALARRSYVDPILEEFGKQVGKLAGFRLGICSLATLFRDAPSRILTNSQQIGFSEGQSVHDIQEGDTESYTVNGITLDNTQLVAFSAIVEMLSRQQPWGNNPSNELLDFFLQNRFFVRASRLAIFCILLLLLGNFFVFSHFFRANQAISEQNAINENLYGQLKTARERVLKKNERFLQHARANSRTSVILNEMMRALPPTITLNSLEYSPIEGKIKPGEEIRYEDKTFEIKGITVDNLLFSEWIEKLKAMPDISSVTIVQFGKNETGDMAFELKIKLR